MMRFQGCTSTATIVQFGPPASSSHSSIRSLAASSGSSLRTSSMKRLASSRRMKVSIASPGGTSVKRASSTTGVDDHGEAIDYCRLASHCAVPTPHV